MFVSLDLIGITAALAKELQTKMATALEWPGGDASRIMISCTHTHTGPQTNGQFLGMGHATEAYMEQLTASIVEAALQANADVKPARLLHRQTPVSGISINRRQRVATGENDDATAAAAKKVKW